MASAIRVRDDYSSEDLRRLARGCRDADPVRRLLALAVVIDGASRTEAAKVGGVTLQIVRDWVIRFNAEGPEGLKPRKAPGKRPILNDAQRRALAEQVETGPIPAAHGVVLPKSREFDSPGGFPRGENSESMTPCLGGCGHGFSDRLAR